MKTAYPLLLVGLQGIGLISAVTMTDMAERTAMPQVHPTARPLFAGYERAEVDSTLSREPQDPWVCATENMTQYFDVPKPTGTLFSALVDYGRVAKSRTCTSSFDDWLRCPEVQPSVWCAFTTFVPSTLLSEYSAHASKASSWSSVHRSGLAALPTSCPITWKEAGTLVLDGDLWLNFTLSWAQCYAEEHANDDSSSSSSSSKGQRVVSRTSSSG